MKITPTNHTAALRWLLDELHGGNAFSKDTLWSWSRQAAAAPSNEPCHGQVLVDSRSLRHMLDYLHDSEADHYEDTVENDPDDADDHVYRHVLAIEQELKEGAR
jgi:gamma-glutamylcyclotransferase (GGCT)/AIG2-like uncharacterized protein YtfP